MDTPVAGKVHLAAVITDAHTTGLAVLESIEDSELSPAALTLGFILQEPHKAHYRASSGFSTGK